MRTPVLLVSVVLLGSVVAQAGAQDAGVREVTASDRTLIPLTTKVRYTTMILLPDHEEILDVVCGDRDFWVISATHNIVHLKPAKEGAATNLNVVTTSGTVYSFLVSEQKTGTPDLKVYVVADSSASVASPRYYAAREVEALRADLAATREGLDGIRRAAEETVATFQRDYPLTLQFPFGTPKYERPFFVRSIWHDGAFTYIKTDARELPALYEVKDGQPAVVNFQVHDGTYVVPKVLGRAYLTLGKDRFEFQQGR